LSLTFVVAAIADERAPAPAARLQGLVGERAVTTISGATRVEVYRLSIERGTKGERGVGGYQVNRAEPGQGDEFARRLSTTLLEGRTYDAGERNRCKFEPEVAFRAWSGEAWAEVLVSFRCGAVVVRGPDEGRKSIRSAKLHLSEAGRTAMLELVRAALGEGVTEASLRAEAEKKSKRAGEDASGE
jgi:hypothetical protein